MFTSPFPVRRDPATADFLDGTARGEFLLVRDGHTGAVHEPQFDTTADPERYVRVPAAGTATIVSWSVVHQRGADGTVRQPVGIVELDEGPWWWTAIDGVSPDDDLVGRRVRVAYAEAGDETIPYFTAVEE